MVIAAFLGCPVALKAIMTLLTFKFVKENFSSNPLDLTNSYPSHLINLIPA